MTKYFSVNILKSLEHAKNLGAQICGIVGRDGGYTAQVADACVIIPEINSGQLNSIIRSKFLINTESLSKVEGKPFTPSEIYSSINGIIKG